ncbi:WD40 repeat-like protein [Terfezia boudieri ATCC MYA-4762]|uniref:WD40 repeat-like protein n=1 Tax=Terfezia boudieri ATCC MYA-4762 TaxID=1051890 RepID=A0A3N4LPW9_9PEZI|nr:WD40 repeat-like protein [Terfezia boudieri ATCC MYA-4762]
MASKRKRSNGPAQDAPSAPARTVNTTPNSSSRPLLPPVVLDANESRAVNLQIITGSYEKVLHGFIASIPVTSLSSLPRNVALTTTFSDSFLFTAHTAPLRCVALSPPSTSKSNSKSSKRILATGSPDERVNLYTLSSSISALLPSASLEAKAKSTARNKHLGTLHEHTNTPCALLFTPNRNKLITAGEDSQILIFRTRDWSLLSTLKAPKPKSSASASGIGLLGNGERPGGVNDIALHPSQKLLLSVSKGERALRMWNLMTGRKAGALAFTREVMGSTLGNKIGGSSGDGQKVRWSPVGEEFAVAFERGVVVFGMDSQPKLRILPSPISKVHQIHYITLPGDDAYVLAISTEDGRIIFYSTTAPRKTKAEESENDGGIDIDNPIVLGHVGGREMGMVGRVKDFVILEADKALFPVSAGSDGTIRIWAVDIEQIKERLTAVGSSAEPPSKKAKKPESDQPAASAARKIPQLGNLVGIYETGKRVTCLSGMVMEEGWNINEADESDEDETDKDEEREDSDG